MREGEVGGLAGGSFQLRELGDEFRDGVAHFQFAVVLQHQDCDGGDGLRHRHDVEERVGRHRAVARDIRESGGLEVEDFVLRHDHRNRATDFIFRDRLPHRGADAGELGRIGGDERGREDDEGENGEGGEEAGGVHGNFCGA
jgi:hypothetical protein